MHGIDHAIGEGPNGFTVFNSTLDDFVVDVGDVANVCDLVAAGFEPALNNIKGHIGASVSDMTQVIHRHAANIHADMASLCGREIGNSAGQRVVNAQAHETVFLVRVQKGAAAP